MTHKVKCPECNGCMSPFWVLPNRYYFCDFCLTYYGGMVGELKLVPKETVYAQIQQNAENQGTG